MTAHTAPAGAPTGLARLLRQSDAALALVVMLVVVMMVVPLPPQLLDVLITLNIATATTVLLVSLYAHDPLDFSVFPSLLLVLTLFRLALNVSTTRLILLHAHAGNVIQAFGHFVIGGSLVVGLVVFTILMIIQFVVITNGAGRVAEVAARFTLDAMPGKQMSIDADLNAGLIKEPEARHRRQLIELEADFYGAMDGASKFVKGDAIAALIIVAVNIFGGIAIGVMQKGLSIQDALGTYSLLTVGEGLVSQIPALLISTATGIIVTRSATQGDLGTDVTRQLFGNPRALTIVAALLVGMAAVPGLPKLPFLAIAAVVGVTAYFVRQHHAQQLALTAASAIEPAPPPTAVESVVNLLQLDPLELEIGAGLVPLVDESAGGTLLQRVSMIRRQIALELGVVVPTVRIRDNLQLGPNTYVVRLRGVEIGRGDLLLHHYLAMNAGAADGSLDGLPTTEPAFGLPAVWIAADQRDRAEILGYTVVDPTSVVATHLTELVRRHAHEILSRQDVQTLLNNLKADYPAVVEELVPGLLTLGEVQHVLQSLLQERVSVRDLLTICETLASHARTTRDPDLLTEYARQALSRLIVQPYAGADKALTVMTLSPRVEQRIAEHLQATDQGVAVVMDPAEATAVMSAVARRAESMAGQGLQPVLLCSSRVRRSFRRLSERTLPNVVVLSYNEVPPEVEVRSVGMVEVMLSDAA